MKNAARILYKIGKVFSIISLIASVLMIILAVAGIAMKEDLFQSLVNQGNTDITSVEQLLTLLIGMIVVFAISVVIEAVRLNFVGKAINALGTDEKVPHIVLLVLGVINTGIFYIIASIMGLVLASKTSNPTPPAQNNGADNNANVQ